MLRDASNTAIQFSEHVCYSRDRGRGRGPAETKDEGR